MADLSSDVKWKLDLLRSDSYC